MAENQPKFSCKYELTEELFNEYQSTVRPMRGFKILYKSIFLISIALMFVLKLYMYAAVFACAYFLTGLVTVFLMKMVYRLLKGSGDTVTLNYEFYENNILFSNLTTSGKKELLYTYIADIVETKNAIILNLKEQSSIMVKKENLQGGTRDELIKFLMKKAKDEDMVITFVPFVETRNKKAGKVVKKVVNVVVAILFIISIVLTFMSSSNNPKLELLPFSESIKLYGFDIGKSDKYDGATWFTIKNIEEDLGGIVALYDEGVRVNSKYAKDFAEYKVVGTTTMLDFKDYATGFMVAKKDGTYVVEVKYSNAIIEIEAKDEAGAQEAINILHKLIVKEN